MVIKLIITVLSFLTIVSLVSAIYLGWEKSEESYKEKKNR